MSEIYRVKLKSALFEIEVESSDKEFVLNHLEEYKSKAFNNAVISQQARPIITPTVVGLSTNNNSKKLSINEFFKLTQPSGSPEVVVMITYFKEKYEDCKDVTTRDITEGMQILKHKCANASAAISRARASGFLMDAVNKKNFTLTNTGEKFIEEKIGNLL